uniref:Uncharacterized protein n=1 Tax=Eutreptiella gymnastica TaxID=73025 RepID=A0A7S4GFS9_9EUGL
MIGFQCAPSLVCNPFNEPETVSSVIPGVHSFSSFPLTCKCAGSLQDGNSTTCVRASSTCQSIVGMVLWGVSELLYYFYYSYCQKYKNNNYMTWRRAALYTLVLCTHATAKPVAEAAAIPCAEPSVKVQPNLPPGSQASLQPSLWLENFAISTYAPPFGASAV